MYNYILIYVHIQELTYNGAELPIFVVMGVIGKYRF